MTGFRVGFIFANKEIIKTLGGLVSQSTSGVTTMCQYATIEVLKGAKNITRKVNMEMRKRRDIFINEFNKAFKCRIMVPESGLYVFVPLSIMGWKDKNSNKFCRLAIEKAGVATVPGSAFGREGYVRFSFGERSEILKQGICALALWIKKEIK